MKRLLHPLTCIVLSFVSSVAVSRAQLDGDSLPILSVEASPTNEGLIGLVVTFNLSSPAAGGERFNFDLLEGSATFADFIPFDVGIVEFEPGETSVTKVITMLDDFSLEDDETFQLSLSNPQGLTFADSFYTLTILNDDDAITLPSFFSDGMVLQREKGAKVWGYVCANCDVTVGFDNRSWTARSGADGRFEVTLDNLAASSIGRDLVVTVGEDVTRISNVLVGEVWMGAGQSNMEFPFSFLPTEENNSEAENANDPLLRIYVPIEKARPSEEVLLEGDWLSAVPGDMPDMPALPYYYAKRLRAELGVPVAIIECAWGGQPIQGFISEEKLATFPEGVDAIAEKAFFYNAYAASFSEYESALAAWNANPVGPQPEPPADDPRFEANLAGQIYNGMVAPLVGYGLRGILFYQGEANTFAFSPTSYQPFLTALAEDWRARWGEELPFYYAQLANFVSENRPQWVNVQNEQRLALATIPQSGMMIGNDIGDRDDIHPANKSDFGPRLARLPLFNEYGQSDLIPTGPIYRDSTFDGTTIVVEFDYASGLTTSDGQSPKSFEVRVGNGPWSSVQAEIMEGNVVIPFVSEAGPVAVRYAWSPDPQDANLRNSAGLPASVFAATPQFIEPPVEIITVTASAAATNEGLVGLPVLFTLSSPARGGERFEFSLQDQTAKVLEDYAPYPSGVVEFAAGATSFTVFLTVIDDLVPEPDETFSISFSNPSGLALGQSQLELTILNDDTVEEPTEVITVTASTEATNEGLIGLPVRFDLSSPAQGGEQFNFTLVGGSANPLEDYLLWTGGVVAFASGETSQTLWLTLVDDAVIEPNETFSIQFSNPVGLSLSNELLTLTILNDDSVLDDFGGRFGLLPEQRLASSDDDGDGLGLFLEYAFNLDPTVANSPQYVSGETINGKGEPFGLPSIVRTIDSESGGEIVKYVFIRRTDSYPFVEYFSEVSEDGETFEIAQPDKVTPIGDHWEEVEIVIGGVNKVRKRCFARVRVEAND